LSVVAISATWIVSQHEESKNSLDGTWVVNSHWQFASLESDSMEGEAVKEEFVLLNNNKGIGVTFTFNSRRKSLSDSDGNYCKYDISKTRFQRQIRIADKDNNRSFRSGIYIVDGNSLLILVHSCDRYPRDFLLEDVRETYGQLIQMHRMEDAVDSEE
jgi:hypothetical protein